MKLEEDKKQKLKATLSFGLESFKVFMATLLSLFVPQKCDGRVCELDDNINDLNDYNTFVLAFNFFTLGMFIYKYIIEYRREHWCIDYLDVEPEKSSIYLRNEIEHYPEYKKKLIDMNKTYKNITIYLLIVSSLNFVFSSVLVIGFYYLDYRTITVLLSNTLLVVDKLYNSWNISRKSFKEFLAYSVYMKTPVLFNTIDKDHRKELSNVY